MANNRIPGPLDSEGLAGQIKDGTLPLAASPSLGPIRATFSPCPVAEEVIINFGPNADKSAMTLPALNALREICAKACVPSVQITSTARTAADQARIMYEMIQARGVQYAKQLYGGGGQQVVEAYEEAEKKNLSADEIKAVMLARINEVGPNKVSRHVVGGDGKLCVFDIAPSSIPASLRAKFVKEAKTHARVKRFFGPPQDPAYHLEVEN